FRRPGTPPPRTDQSCHARTRLWLASIALPPNEQPRPMWDATGGLRIFSAPRSCAASNALRNRRAVGGPQQRDVSHRIDGDEARHPLIEYAAMAERGRAEQQSTALAERDEAGVIVVEARTPRCEADDVARHQQLRVGQHGRFVDQTHRDTAPAE